ncbi:hypothetical protein B0H11DRAFT_1810084 [Mycena galericulata]|nr:hypothetical protein B0H11DRAFT_1810084 [Mycena galericulata]
MDFRNYLYSPMYIKLNAGKFLDHEWVDIPTLKEYLRQIHQNPGLDASSTRPATPSDPVRVKIETPLPSTTPRPAISVKAEPQPIRLPPPAGDSAIKMRTLTEGGREVIEVLSDSDSDAADSDSDLEVMEVLQTTSRSSSTIPTPCDAGDANVKGSEFEDPGEDSGAPPSPTDLDELNVDSDLVESDTFWPDEGKSFVITGKFRPTQKVTVDRMEYRDGPAAIYPIPRVRTAFVIDLSHRDYMLRDPGTKELYTLDTIIRNADNDSWESGSGGQKSKAYVTFSPGGMRVLCRRARSTCKGCHACERIDPELHNISRFELDPAPFDAVLSAQAETRRREGNTPEENVAVFMKIIRDTKCAAIDSKGVKCNGGPIMRVKAQGPSNGHHYFIACSSWTPKCKENHCTLTIPDFVNEHLLAKALAGQPLTDDPDKNTQPCSRIVHPHTGLKRKHCPHIHIVNGTQVQSRIVNHPCPATRSIYVPMDSSIRKVLIVHNDTGHNHPMPPLTKLSFGAKDVYRECIEKNGVLGATVSKIDNAQSTLIVLGGKTPAEFSPALYNQRAKRDLLHTAKREKYPAGLDVAGIFPIYLANLKKPLPERYIHSYLTTPDGGIIILTSVPYLMKLLDDPGVTSFDNDTTYKRVEGEMNEWELTIFAKIVQRAASVVRAYINRASADFFETLFDELQRVKLQVTGKPMPLKKIVRGGNLLVMNADMEAAQVVGITRSVMKHNDPEYSGIPNDTPPEKVAPNFVKICWRHAKEPVNDFKSLVSATDFNRILDFVYIDSKERLDAFSAFVYGLGIKKISDWWKHKEMHEWIIPCLVKSQSLIPADVWDSTPSTTNTNEAQHHWTNSQTGIKLTPVETVERTEILDNKVAQEIEMSRRTGVMANSNNELVHRVGRSVGRHTTTARKKREGREVADATHQLQLQIEAEAEKRRESNRLTKTLKEQLKTAKGTSATRGNSAPSAVLSASSSGRVRTTPPVRSAPTPMVSTQSEATGVPPTDPPARSEASTPIVSVQSEATGVLLTGPPLPAPSMDPPARSEAPTPIVSAQSEATGVLLTGPPLPAPSMPQHDSERLAGNSMLAIWSDPNFDLTTMMDTSNFEVPSVSPFSDVDFSTFDSNTFFGLSSDFNAPGPSAVPANDPLHDLMNFSDPSFLTSDFGNLCNFADFLPFTSAGSSVDELPFLPPPPPESAPFPVIENLLEPALPKSRRPRQEVDEANIITSTRCRAPSERKRVAEEALSNPPKKRRNAGK